MRGETCKVKYTFYADDDFNPLSPCGERPYGKVKKAYEE